MKTVSKKLISIMLVLVLSIGCLPLGNFGSLAEAPQSQRCGNGLSWSYDSSSLELTISGDGEMYDYSNGSTPWNDFKEQIKTVKFSGYVNSIGNNAFNGCTSLNFIDFSSLSGYGPTEIGDYAFLGCISLTHFFMQPRNCSVGKNAFDGCERLSTLVIGLSPKIGEFAFSGCSSLTFIYIYNKYAYGFRNSSTIDKTAFSGVKATLYNSDLDNVKYNDFGGDFTYKKMTAGIIGYDAYWSYDLNGEKLTIYGSGGLFKFSGGSQLPWMEEDSRLGYYCNIKSIDVNEGITSIPSYAFEYMGSVEQISLPNSLLTLYPNAFNDCKSLKEIVIPHSVEYVDGSTYWNRCPNLTDVYYVGTESDWNNIYSCQDERYKITPHFLTYHPSTQTCTEVGYPAHYEFDGTDNNTFYDLDMLPMENSAPGVSDHEFSTEWSTDETDHWHICTLCGITVSDRSSHVYDNACDATCDICGYIRTIEHSYPEDYSFDDDSHWKSCTVCGNITDYGAHAWDDGVITLSPTCTENGVLTYTCSVCGKTREELINAKGHTIVTDHAISATCTADGKTEGSHCSECGVIFVAQRIIPALGHTWDDGLITQQPNCTEYGIKTYTCLVCKETKTESIEATGHTVVIDDAIPATCIAEGKTEGSHCSKCGEIFVAQQIIPALGHTWDDGLITQQPNCTEDGVKTYTCLVCKETKTESIEATGHTIVIDGAAPVSCTMDGKTEGSHCAVCGEIINPQQIIPALGHDYSSGWHISKDHHWHECDICGHIEDLSDHCFDDDEDTICNICDYEREIEYDVTVGVRPVYAVSGKEFTVPVFISGNKGFSYLELTPVFSDDLTLVNIENGNLIGDLTIGNQYVWASNNNIARDGKLMTFTFTTSDDISPGRYEISFTLRNCFNKEEKTVSVEIIDGFVEIIDFIYGDANGDGKINGSDVIRLKKYIANYDYENGTSTIEISAGADANGDGVINGQDVVRLMNYLANYDYDLDYSTVILGPQD